MSLALSLPIALECMQPVARWEPQVIQSRCHIKVFQFPRRTLRDIRRGSNQHPGGVQLSGMLVSDIFCFHQGYKASRDACHLRLLHNTVLTRA